MAIVCGHCEALLLAGADNDADARIQVLESSTVGGRFGRLTLEYYTTDFTDQTFGPHRSTHLDRMPKCRVSTLLLTLLMFQSINSLKEHVRFQFQPLLLWKLAAM